MLSIMVAAALTGAQFGLPRPGEDYAACLDRVAVELEPSRESAEAVAHATVSACQGLRPAAPSDSPKERKAFQDMFDRYAAEGVATRIVRLRACQQTKGCNAFDLLWPNSGKSAP